MRRSGAVIDLAAVLLFVGIGRSVHDHGLSIAGMVSTAWPFVGTGSWLARIGHLAALFDVFSRRTHRVLRDSCSRDDVAGGIGTGDGLCFCVGGVRFPRRINARLANSGGRSPTPATDKPGLLIPYGNCG